MIYLTWRQTCWEVSSHLVSKTGTQILFCSALHFTLLTTFGFTLQSLLVTEKHSWRGLTEHSSFSLGSQVAISSVRQSCTCNKNSFKWNKKKARTWSKKKKEGKKRSKKGKKVQGKNSNTSVSNVSLFTLATGISRQILRSSGTHWNSTFVSQTWSKIFSKDQK